MRITGPHALIITLVAAICLALVPSVSLAAIGSPPIALQLALKRYMGIPSSAVISYGPGYGAASLCPTARNCMTRATVYLIGYTIGDGSGEAVIIGNNRFLCASCYTYTVIYSGGGPMDEPTLEGLGISRATAKRLIHG